MLHVLAQLEEQMKTVIVHGIKQYRPESPSEAAAFYADEWRAALTSAPGFPWPPEHADVRAAYYSHLLTERGRQGGEELGEDAREILAALLEPWFPSEAGAQGYGTWPLRTAIAKLAKHHRLSEKRTTWFLERFVSEVAAFFRTEGSFNPKSSVIDTVAETLRGATIVIAHSLGSIVVYETLWRYHINIPILVTVGSPLAIPKVIHPQLTPAPVNGLGAKPPGVERWINFADHGDIVAVPPKGIGRAFTGVNEDIHGHIAPFDFHRITNYLKCSTMGKILADWHTSRP